MGNAVVLMRGLAMLLFGAALLIVRQIFGTPSFQIFIVPIGKMAVGATGTLAVIGLNDDTA